MTRGELVAAEVEKWNRTPFHQQQAVRGKGCDCKGLVWGVARDLGFPEAQSLYATFTNYDLAARNGIPTKLLLEGMRDLFWPGTAISPGCVLLHKLGGAPGHMSIASRTEGRAWHAQIAPNDYVKEASLRAMLKLFPLHSIWRWRD